MGLRRKPQGFNLAFLDIMACGLGAIILIFMLVKYHTDHPGTETFALQTELVNVQDEITSIEADNHARAAQIEKLKQTLQQKLARATQVQRQSSATAEELVRLSKEIVELEKKLAQAAAQKPDKPVGDKITQKHLIGLRVSGARILILLDNSASMAAELLVDILKIKVSNTATKKSAPKWQRAETIARWIVERVPDDSKYMVIHYNANAHFLTKQQWRRGDDKKARAQVYAALEKLYPDGATNLQAALKLVKTIDTTPTDIYVITDGLPTKGAKRCNIFSSNSKATVSGECRLELFKSATRSFSSPAKINTVLLPIEGDPEAAYAYWLWSAATTGMMISPAREWP